MGNMDNARSHHACGVTEIDSKFQAIVAGGFDTSNTPQDTAEIYDLSASSPQWIPSELNLVKHLLMKGLSWVIELYHVTARHFFRIF